MSNSNPLISVIMPAYNAESHLAKTLASVFTQTYSNIELIVVNDGSTDHTDQILSTFQLSEPRLKVIFQENSGVAAARNRGLAHAQGDFVSFIDSDDRWAGAFLNKLINRQQQTGANVVYTGYVECTTKGEKPKKNDFREHHNLAGYLAETSLVHIGNLLIKRAFLTQHALNFDAELRTGEDILFICSLFCLTEASCVAEYLYYYEHRPDSLMRRPWTKQCYLNDLMAWQHLNSYLDAHYHQNDRVHVLSLSESKLVYYKLRLLWMLLLAGRYDEIDALLADNFLSYSADSLSYVPHKYGQKRRKIIEKQNRTQWRLTRLLHRGKVNLV